MASLPNGWTVVWSNDEGHFSEVEAAAVSYLGSAAIVVHVNETCMHSTASLFGAGERRWRIHHEGDERIDFLETDGDLPPEYAGIETEARAQQAIEDDGAAEVDWLFDVPLRTAEAVCGYKHDGWRFEWGEPSFTVAEPRREPTPVHVSKSGLIARLFGR